MLSICFPVCSRPTASRYLKRADVELSAAQITLQLRFSKYSERGSAPRVALRVPVAPRGPDLIRTLFTRLCRAADSSQSYLFACSSSLPLPASNLTSTLEAPVCSPLSPVALRPPAPNGHAPRSLRSGGISAAYAAGVSLPVIMRLSNHYSSAVVHKHYLDALAPPSAAGDVFSIALCTLARPLRLLPRSNPCWVLLARSCQSRLLGKPTLFSAVTFLYL